MERMTPDTTDFNSLSKKQLVELVITKYNDCFKLEEENKKLKEELSKKNMDIWFDEKAKNIFIDKSGKVIKGGEFTTLC